MAVQAISGRRVFFAEVCACAEVMCVRAAQCRAGRLKLCKRVTMSKLNLRTSAHSNTHHTRAHAHARHKVRLKDKGVGVF